MNIAEAFVYGIPRVTSKDGTFMTVTSTKPGVVNISDLTVHRPFVELTHPTLIKFTENNISTRQAEFIRYFIGELQKMQVVGDTFQLDNNMVELLKRLPLKHGPAKKPGGLTFAQMKGCLYAGAKQGH